MTEVRLAAKYLPAVLSGRKSTTVRAGTRDCALGPAVLVCGAARVPVRIDGVRVVKFADLTDHDAQCDGFASLCELQGALREHYPGLQDGEVVSVISFTTHAGD